MPVHLTLAYVVFCGVPFGLALSLAWRRRRVERALRERHSRQRPLSQTSTRK